ncbi:ABC transporter permease [Mesorhizobium sp. DCY119]|uniref:ABC transporter permease n=1 Tax=Mesorhizobium sp. DCY119 TaxID=2108445 RepID=UPI000E76144D|nr:ABC transporter permease [Mesorhizobium sp. DCY119]RJG40595.1 ABC transporter permease [Mesorhizobium sp. DCY119]
MIAAERLGRLAAGSTSVVVLLGAWEILSRTRIANPVLLPAPSDIAVTLANIVGSGQVLMPAAYTLGLLAIGYALACVFGVTLGIAMGLNSAIAELFDPLVELFRPIPKPALIPPLFLFLGIGVNTMIFVVALAGFFPILTNTIQAMQGIDRTLLSTARTFRLSPLATLWKIILPAAVPMILTGMRVSLALALIIVTVAEVLAGENGIGYQIMDKQQSYQIKPMYAWLIILAALGFCLNALFQHVEARFTKWRAR